MSQPKRSSHRLKSQKQNSFLGGAAILAAGILVVKIIGMFYKIPLFNIIGEQGTTDFSNAYNIYAVLLTISTAGLPVAVSKLVSEASALGRGNHARRIFYLSLAIFLGLGVVSFFVMYFQADLLAAWMHDAKAAPGIQALAPAVVCVGCLAAFRGYSQGRSNMTPTAVSQIIEAVCKLAVGLFLAKYLIDKGQPEYIAAAGAITGVTVGTVVAMVYMLLTFLFGLVRERNLYTDKPGAAGGIVRDILRIAIPITLSSSMVGLVTVIDSALVQGQLQRTLLENPDSWALYAGHIDFTQLEQTLDAWKASLGGGVEANMRLLLQQSAQDVPLAAALHKAVQDISRTLFGNYSGALNIYNLPTSLMAAITASVIPAISGVLARRDRRGSARLTASVLRLTALLCFPMGVGLFVMGTPIIMLLFPSLNAALAGPLLSTLGLATVFVCMMLVCNSILQAHGFVNLPVLVMLLGGAVKVVANYNVVSLPGVGIYGAPLGNILCFGLCLVLNLLIIARLIPNRPAYLPMFLKPAVASALVGGAAWAVYGLVARLLLGQEGLSHSGNAVATLAAIGVAAVVYGVLVVALRAISRDDLALMPKGEKLARILRL